MNKPLQSKLKNRKGFTLSEILIALGITVILLAIGMVAVVQYNAYMKQTQMDRAAKEIFVAAQNHLAAAEASGELAQFKETNLSDKGNVKLLGSSMKEKPSDMSDGEWSGADNKAYYYLNSAERSDAFFDDTAIKFMLPFGAIDDTVRTEGSYIIEYNVETASIYGVFYTEGHDLIYDEEVAYLDGCEGRADTREGKKIRRQYERNSGVKFVIGYYGGAMADELALNDIEAPKLNIVNGDILSVEITDGNYFKTDKNGDTLMTNITLTVEGEDSGNKREIELLLSDDKTDPKKKDTSMDDWWTVETVTASGIGVAVDKALKYVVNLDNITKKGGHFADICPELIPGEDVIITATCSSSHSLVGVKQAQAVTNSLFESVTVKKDRLGKSTAQAEISCVRHLENLDSAVSKLPMAVTATTQATGDSTTSAIEYVVTTATQTADVDWTTFAAVCSAANGGGSSTSGSGTTSISVYGPTDGTGLAAALAKNSYYGIQNKNLTEYNGNGYAIRNIEIDSDEAGASAGIFAAVASEQKLIVRDLSVENIKIASASHAGALIGSAEPAKEISIKRVAVLGAEISTTDGNAGGMVGNVSTASTGKIAISDCTAAPYPSDDTEREKFAFKIEAQNGAAGGLVGSIDGVGTTEIKNTYSGGTTENGAYSKTVFNVSSTSGAAGGLIGSLTANGATIASCYSTCSASGQTVGGFVGSDNNGAASSYTDCYATGLVAGGATAGTAKVGAFAGSVANATNVNNVYYLSGINSANGCGSGADTVTGITGKSYSDMVASASSGTAAGTSGAAGSSGAASGSSTAPTETHTYDTTLTSSYPFKTVNKTMAQTAYGKASGVHYGDWEKPTQKQTKPVGFAYREMIGENSYWYVPMQLKEDGTVDTSKPYNTLITDKGTTVASANTSYGYLSQDLLTSDDFEDNKINLSEYGTNGQPDEVEIDGSKYYYYTKGNSAWRSSATSTEIVTTPKLKVSETETIAFTFNPDFAAAISKSDEAFDFGESTGKRYEVRTEEQLNNVAKYSDKNFKQTCDIDLSDTYTGNTDTYTAAVVDKTFAGSYTAKCKGGDASTTTRNNGYRISDLNQSVSGAASCGLFAAITGTVDNVYLSGGAISVTGSTGNSSGSSESLYVGSLTGNLNGGSAESCYSDVKITVKSGDARNVSVYAGGLVGKMEGTSSNNPRLTDCEYAGSIAGDLKWSDYSWLLKSIDITGYVGGVIGDITSGKVENCRSRADITVEATADLTIFISKKTTAYVGGFAGLLDCSRQGSGSNYTYTYGTINDSWSKAKISWSSNMGDSSYIGGFAGYMKAVSTGGYGGWQQQSTTITQPKINNSYAATYFKENEGTGRGLFIGYSPEASSSSINNGGCNLCHALEFKDENRQAAKVSSKRFIASSNSNNNIQSTSCYALSNPSNSNDVTYIKNTEWYKNIGSFSGFGNTVWTITNGAYPTLIGNPE